MFKVAQICSRRAASSLVLAEVNGSGELQAGSLSAITAASKIGGDVAVLGKYTNIISS